MSETIGIYAVYDIKGDRYDTPFFALDDLNAERKFVFNFDNNDTIFSKFKNDFKLMSIGSFNVIDGQIITEKRTIIEGLQIAREEK